MKAFLIASAIAGVLSAENLSDWTRGYFNGFNDAVIMMEETMDLVDEKEADTNITLDKETYRKLLRKCFRAMKDVENNPKVKKLMKELYQ